MPAVMASGDRTLNYDKSEFWRLRFPEAHFSYVLKNEDTRCETLRDFRSRIRYSPKIALASMDSGTDGVSYISFEGNEHACNVWWNGSKRKANLNWFDNEWNDNYWFAFVRNSLHSPPFLGKSGVSFSTFLIHPPSILPISLSGSESRVYFLLSSTFSSHAICKKNFNRSSFPLALCSIGSFCDRESIPAMNISSMVSKNRASILAPSVNLDFLGKLFRNSSQSL